MANRPSMLDLRSNSNQSASSTSPRSYRSPPVHMAGGVPPELSPLDAFALQSRLLAKQLQDSIKDGSRDSRLPPLTAESPLVQQGRSEFFRTLSHDSASEGEDTPGLGLRTEVEEPQQRPLSMHPRMSRVPPIYDDVVPAPQHPRHLQRGRQLNPVQEQSDYFGARQERSPSPMHSDTQSHPDKQPDRSPAHKDKSLPMAVSQHHFPAVGSKPGSSDELGLAPPRALYPKCSPSIMSSPVLENEETSSNLYASFHYSPMRKPSSANTAFTNAMPSPAISSFHRSPSIGSDSSAIPRPSLNFSRPLSRAETPPSLEIPTRQASSDSQPSFIFADESGQTPISMYSEAFGDQQPDDARAAAPSYIYSTFCLPRGKALQRSESADSQRRAPILREQPILPYRPNLGVPPSPPTRPSSSSAKSVADDAVSITSGITRPSMETGKGSMESPRFCARGHLSPSPSILSVDAGRKSEDVPRGRPPTARGKTPASVGTSDSASTIRPPPHSRSFAPSASEMSAEEHLAKGIKCHENGSLNESTYHLRHAVKQNDPTAMLLYALACRHGWGMRANQKEGVEWLRKAAEYASIEIADDEDRAKEGRPANFLESKARKAQFALSVYELGVSHMNGWGIEQDRSLALRCFEIAGNWGDVDALGEAGFCYGQGLGCKKDLKKSAKFYRMAEAKGMSMVGNSWIHKAKYNDDDKDASNKKDKNKKARSKSRTRTMFCLKPGT